jgi:hypothetical protein
MTSALKNDRSHSQVFHLPNRQRKHPSESTQRPITDHHWSKTTPLTVTTCGLRLLRSLNHPGIYHFPLRLKACPCLPNIPSTSRISNVSKSAWMIRHGRSSQLLWRDTRSAMSNGQITGCSCVTDQLVSELPPHPFHHFKVHPFLHHRRPKGTLSHERRKAPSPLPEPQRRKEESCMRAQTHQETDEELDSARQASA